MTALHPKAEETCSNPPANYSDLRALFLSTTLKKSPEPSHTEDLMRTAQTIMGRNAIATELVRVIDHQVAFGVYPDMTEHGWTRDDWPAIQRKVMAADILVIGTPIWLGEESPICRWSSSACTPIPASSTIRVSTRSTAGSAAA